LHGVEYLRIGRNRSGEEEDTEGGEEMENNKRKWRNK
jgi:hypothetical protein